MRGRILLVVLAIGLSGCTKYGQFGYGAVVRGGARAVIAECESYLASGVGYTIRADIDEEIERRGFIYRSSPPICE